MAKRTLIEIEPATHAALAKLAKKKNLSIKELATAGLNHVLVEVSEGRLSPVSVSAPILQKLQLPAGS